MHLCICLLKNRNPPSTIGIHLSRYRCARHSVHWQPIINNNIVVSSFMPQCQLEHAFLVILCLSEYFLYTFRPFSKSRNWSEYPAITKHPLADARRLNAIIAPETRSSPWVHISWSRPFFYFVLKHFHCVILLFDELLPVQRASRSWEEFILELCPLYVSPHWILTSEIPLNSILAANLVTWLVLQTNGSPFRIFKLS